MEIGGRILEGAVSLWAGQCEDQSTLFDYLSTVYTASDPAEEPGEVERQEPWCSWYRPENRNRPCEAALKDFFRYERFNRFAYDFGMIFNEDCCESWLLQKPTEDPEKLFRSFSCGDLLTAQLKQVGVSPDRPWNAAVALYDFSYEGGIPSAEHGGIRLQFLGVFRYRSPQSGGGEAGGTS